MKRFIGTKIIKAENMNLGDYNDYRGWNMPKDEDPAREGYLVLYPDGYESWSPAEVFEEAYKQTDGMTLGLAVEATIKGHEVIRDGWNGNGMCVAAQMPGKNSKMTHPYLYIKVPGCEEGTRYLPWQPSQVDIFAIDYRIV